VDGVDGWLDGSFVQEREGKGMARKGGKKSHCCRLGWLVGYFMSLFLLDMDMEEVALDFISFHGLVYRNGYQGNERCMVGRISR